MRVLGGDLFRAAGAGVRYAVRGLMPESKKRPSDILMDPRTHPDSLGPPRPIAYDVTVSSPFGEGTMLACAKKPRAAANAASARKIRAFTDAVSRTPPEPNSTSRTWFDFVPLAFDSLGCPSDKTAQVIDEHAQQIAMRSHCSTDNVKARLYQRLSYAIWSTCAVSIISRAPQRAGDVVYPLQI